MPFISDAQLAKVNQYAANVQSKLAKAKEKAEEKAGEVKTGLEIVGAAVGVGFVRGKVEKAGKEFRVPGTQIDLELALGLGITGAGLMDAFGKFDQDALNVGYGILAHWGGQIARKAATTGNFSAIAGSGIDLI